jgi:hypothetical protein
LEVEDYKGAAAEFEMSVELYPTKNGLFNLAMAYKAVHRYGEALDQLDELESRFGRELSPEMRTMAREMREEISSIVAHVNIVVNRDGAKILLDGKEMGTSPLMESLVVGPGTHVIEAKLDSYQAEKKEISTVSKAHLAVQLELVKAEPMPAAEAKKPTYMATGISFGIGGAAGIAAIVTGVLQLNKTDQAEQDAADGTCPTKENCESWQQAKNLGIVTNVLIGVAAAGIVAGIIAVVLETKKAKKAKKEKRVSVLPMVTTESAGLVISGRF